MDRELTHVCGFLFLIGFYIGLFSHKYPSWGSWVS